MGPRSPTGRGRRPQTQAIGRLPGPRGVQGGRVLGSLGRRCLFAGMARCYDVILELLVVALLSEGVRLRENGSDTEKSRETGRILITPSEPLGRAWPAPQPFRDEKK